MRKIIIAICGIILAGGAMGADNRIFNTPIKLSNNTIVKAWGMENIFQKIQDAAVAYAQQYAGPIPNANNADGVDIEFYKGFIEGAVEGVFAPNWQFNTKAGTYGTNNEGSITPIIAHEIYEHGGKFCMTQMQAGFGQNTGKFIDYFDDNTGSKRYKCKVICEPGYRGDRCLQSGYDCPSSTSTNYKNDLNNREDDALRLLSGYNKGQIKPEVFEYKNGGTDTNNSFAMVLGLLTIKEHSVIASPVYVTSNKNTITGAYSNKIYNKLLCAPGYEPNEDESDCKLSSYCEQVAELCDDENLDLFNENKNHEWATKIENEKTCKYIACKSGYGFKEGTQSKECEKCETTRIQGVNAQGVCKKCTGSNPMFNGEECVGYKYTLYAKDLLDGIQNIGKCWIKSSRSEYKDCVLCNKGQHWNETNKQCETKKQSTK